MKTLLLAAAVLAVAELDDSLVGQFMLSRPVVIGTAAGAAFSQTVLGTSLGLFYEVFSLDDQPVGGHLPLNATAAAASALLLALGPAGVEPALAVPVGLAFGWIHSRLDRRQWRRREALGPKVEGRLQRGERPRFGRIAAAEAFRQAAMTFSILLAALALRPWLGRGWGLSPESLKAGLRTGFEFAPWLGAAALLHSLRLAW